MIVLPQIICSCVTKPGPGFEPCDWNGFFPPRLCLKWGGSSFGNCGPRHHLSHALHPLALRRKRFNWDTEEVWAPSTRWGRQVRLRPDKGTRAESCLGWRYWELEIKREEWGGYRDKMAWTKHQLHRKGKIKLRFFGVILIICFYFFLLTVMIIEMWWYPERLFYMLSASYSSPTPINIGGSFILLRTSLVFPFLQ